MTPRYVLALIEWVPPSGALAASLRGGRQWLGWSRDSQLLADTWDLHAAVAHAQGGKKARGKAPSYPRPKSTAPPTRTRRRLSSFPGAIDVTQFQQTPESGPTSGG